MKKEISMWRLTYLIRMSVTLIKHYTRLINILAFEKTENAKSK